MARPLFGAILRTEQENGDVTYRFTCDTGTDLIGPAEITCSFRSRKWSHKYSPICLRKNSRDYAGFVLTLLNSGLKILRA